MKTWLTRILIGLVVVLIVALVGGAIFLLTFDPNAYKSRLEELVYERYHRTLSIDGDIELSLFPRIGLAVQDVSLSDRDSADTFAAIDSARFAVAIWPLLSNRLVVDHVAVTGFKAWLVRDDQGYFNFRDLVQNGRSADSPDLNSVLASGLPAHRAFAGYLEGEITPRPQPVVLAATEADRADFQIDIAGLELKGGELHFLDRQTGSTGRVEQLDLTTGRMTFDQAFDVSFKGKLVGVQPSADAQLEGQALVQLDPLQRTYSAQRLNLLLNGMLGELEARPATLRGNLAYNEYSQMFSASSLELLVQGETQGESPIHNLDASLTVPQLRIDRSQAELQVTRLALRARGGQAGSDFDLAVDAPSLAISPELAKSEPVVATYRRNESGDALGVSLQLSGLGGDAFDLTLQELKLDSTHKRDDRLVSIQMSSPATWSPFGRQGGLSAMKGDVRIEDTTLPGGVFQFPFIGSLQADLYKDELTSAINAVFGGNKIDFSIAVNQLDDPHIVFDLTADNLDLNTLFPPPKEPAPGPEADDGEQGGDQQGGQPEAAAQTPVAGPVRQFDWSFLNSAHVQGNIKANTLKAGGLELSALQTGVTAEDGVLHIRDFKAGLYGGSVESNVSFSSDHDVTFDLIAENIDVGPLGQAFMRNQRLLGTADFQASLTTQGVTAPALISDLDGTLKGQVRNGAWVGLDLGQTIVEINEVLRNAFSGQLPDITSRFDPSRRTEFDSLAVEVELQNGQGSFHTLELKSPWLHVSKGEPASVDLVNQQLDIMLHAKGQPSSDPKALDFALLEGITVPVRVSGPFRSPTYQVQWQGIAHRAVQDAIQGGLLDVLSQISGEGGSSFLFPPTGKPDTTKRDPLKSIGDALKGLLGQ